MGGIIVERCKVKPYEGNEDYIFISYCHKDKEAVFPIIEKLAENGYRVWYDEGIDPGSEWPEIIADHLNGCSVCIACISNNSINSHNCRREVTFALMKKKKFISVILEETELSLGMEMQLSATQAIFKYKLDSDEEFFDKIYATKSINNCNGISKTEKIKNTIDIQDTTKADKPTKKEYIAYFIRNKTGEKGKINKEEYKIGRSNTMSDFIITENGLIGRYHARIVKKRENYYLIDNTSKNKTRLNDKELIPEKEYKLKDNDIIQMANEKFTFLLKEIDK